MIEIIDALKALPANSYTAVRIVNGHVTGTREIKPDEFILTLKALIEMQKLAGYKVVSPAGDEL